MAYYIILENIAGKLDELFVEDESKIGEAIMEMVRGAGSDGFRGGDIIRIVEKNDE